MISWKKQIIIFVALVILIVAAPLQATADEITTQPQGQTPNTQAVYKCVDPKTGKTIFTDNCPVKNRVKAYDPISTTEIQPAPRTKTEAPDQDNRPQKKDSIIVIKDVGKEVNRCNFKYNKLIENVRDNTSQNCYKDSWCDQKINRLRTQKAACIKAAKNPKVDKNPYL